ncbi:MAG: DNA-binding response regulator [Comamonadaceae bacterium SCN 68-20]|jgi:heavy metal response regulator|nr:heavy metal response regulator transcription factor [Comamonadaceae bacterium]ODU59372.1 MAG: DNA-binding response regulator [Comamonadaceae bacterium SCN 68-20]OJX27835.1 MAG: DNA-binding response regulator [Burkholderiales bacterium 68-20]
MRILVVEDDPKQADYLRRGLVESGGHAVDVAHRGDDGLHLATVERYDLFVLDVMLPGLDGFGVLAGLRRATDAPVLMLTARDRVEDRVRGLQSGADDYLVKPFAFSEFLARVQALLRRSGPRRADDGLGQVQLADLELDPRRRRAYRAGRQITLTAQEYSLLALLLQRQGEVLSRNELAEQLWGVSFDSDTNVVEVAVRRLRLKLDHPGEEKLLHTVRGMGYVLERR